MGPDAIGFLEDGTPVYFDIKCARGNGKSMLQLELYRQFFNIPDDEWEEIQQEAKRRLYGFQDEDSQD
jgi:hypothetical protein